MPKVSFMLANGDDGEDLPISDREAYLIKGGFGEGQPFSFIDDEGDWVWFSPEKFASIVIEKDQS